MRRLGQESIGWIRSQALCRIAMTSFPCPWVCPCKEGVVFVHFHDLFLQSVECSTPFTVEQWHVDSKQLHKAVCFIFYSGGFSLGSPRHSRRYIDFDHLRVVLENCLVDSGYARDFFCEAHLRSNLDPPHGIELND